MIFPSKQKTCSECYRVIQLTIVIIVILSLTSCGAPRIKFFSDATDPLKEFTIQGSEKGKVAVIQIIGIKN